MALSNERIEEINRLWDSYFYPGTTTLINKFNIYDKDELAQKEAEVTFEKLVELYENPIKGNFDAEHLRNIHKYIFGDIYEWAGEYRYVNMRKTTGFTDVENIPTFIDGEFKLMNAEIGTIYSVHDLAAFLAEYYVHLMAIHPFREGNGRSYREFLREFVLEKTKQLPTGPYELDWTKFDGDVVLDNIEFSLYFRSAIEMEFFKALTPVTLEEENQIKM